MPMLTNRLLFAARLRRAAAVQSRTHEHTDSWQVEYCLRGPILYDVNGHTCPLPDGALLVIPPGFSHCQDSPKGADSFVLKFQCPTSSVALKKPTVVQLSRPERQIIEPILTSLVHEHDGRAPQRGRMVAVLLSQLLIWTGRWSMTSLVQRQSTARTDASERVRMVGDMLRREYTRSLSVAELARRACLSRSRFQELFRSEFGASPIAFHTRVRMEKAVELGRYTGMSWRQIAAQLGYDDPAYFSRIFKKTMGASPSRLLDQHR